MSRKFAELAELLDRRGVPSPLLVMLAGSLEGRSTKPKDTRLDRTVAIKVLPEPLSTNAALRKPFEREARAVSSWNHPIVVPNRLGATV